MEQTPSQDKNRVEAGLQHQAPPYGLGAWLAPERVKSGHDASFNQCFHSPHPIQVMGRETEGWLLGKIVEGRQPSISTRVGVVEDD